MSCDLFEATNKAGLGNWKVVEGLLIQPQVLPKGQASQCERFGDCRQYGSQPSQRRYRDLYKHQSADASGNGAPGHLLRLVSQKEGAY
jgi:hypothetical protein